MKKTFGVDDLNGKHFYVSVYKENDNTILEIEDLKINLKIFKDILIKYKEEDDDFIY